MPKEPEELEEEKKPKGEEEEEGKEVSVEPDENDEGPETPENRETRNEAKRNRYKEQRESREAAERKLAEYERQLQEERAARAAERAAAEFYVRQAQQPQQQVDPWAESEKNVKDKFQYILSESNRLKLENRLDEAETKRLQQEWIENQQRQQELVARKLLWQQAQYQQAQQPQYEQQQRIAAAQARLEAEFPEVMNHQAAKAHAMGGWQQAIAAGKPNNWDTAREVMATTMRAFRLGRPPPPDDVTRRRYSGVGGGGNGGGAVRTTFKMTKAHEKMAEGRFPSLSPEAAHKKWAQTVGKKILEDDA